jgi:hypothetical protein
MTPAKTRFGCIEPLRVVAILGVIWFHIDGLPHRRVAFSGLIVFVLLTTVLGCFAAQNSGFFVFLGKRAQRLLVPWGVWFGVYFALNLIIGRPGLPSSPDPVSAILAGPWIGLWLSFPVWFFWRRR